MRVVVQLRNGTHQLANPTKWFWIRHGLAKAMLERIAYNQIHLFTSQPDAAIAFAQAFGLRGEFGSAQRALPFSADFCAPQLHPLVPPQVLHFMQVPLRTSV